MFVEGLFIDGFAGGGGASTGIAQAIGRHVDIAINHSASAIAIHRANHPGTEHFCQDIRAVWPLAATRLRPVAGAWFSPDCKEYSKAKGGPVKDRHIRALSNEVTVWLKEVRPTVAYLENVEEYEYAAPLDENGIPIKELAGRDFKRLVRTWRRMGYRVEWKKLRACDYGAPTSRRRLYVIMRCDGLPIVWPEPTHGAPTDPRVIAGELLPYHTAAECIDWTLPCPSIFDRKRPLKDATLRRIAHGVMRYVVNAAEPFIVGTAFTNTRAARTFNPAEPLRTSTTQNEYGVVDAEIAELHGGAIVPVTHSHDSARAHDTRDPLRTITTANGCEFALADVTLAPHITKFHSGSVGAPMDGTMPAVTGNGQPARPAGAMPLGVVGATLVGVGGRRSQSPPMPVDVPAPTGTTKADGAIAAATMVKMGNGERQGQEPRALDVRKPYGTATAKGSQAAAVTAEIAFIDRQFGNSAGAPVDEPLGATTAGGGGKSANVTAFLSSFYGSDKVNGGGEPGQPLRTARAGGQHHALVAAHVEQANTGMVGHTPRRPLSTIVGKGSTQRIVETTLVEEGALPPELMDRAVEVAAFLVKYYATGGENEAAQTQPVDRPLDTATTRARFAVVTVTIDAVTYVIVDIGLRMLKPRELARAQGFPEDYVLDPVVPKVKRGKLVHEPLTIAEQISAIGNSVCPPVARALVAANQPGLTEMRMAA